MEDERDPKGNHVACAACPREFHTIRELLAHFEEKGGWLRHLNTRPRWCLNCGKGPLQDSDHDGRRPTLYCSSRLCQNARQRELRRYFGAADGLTA